MVLRGKKTELGFPWQEGKEANSLPNHSFLLAMVGWYNSNLLKHGWYGHHLMEYLQVLLNLEILK